MQSRNNKLVIASAGAGKTTLLVEEAMSQPGQRLAILTYTNNNIRKIKDKFIQRHGGIPEWVDIMTWFAFLLRECVRPYQRSVYSMRRVKRVHFPEGRSARYAAYSNTEHYYFRGGEEIYADKISRFVIDCDAKSHGQVTQRLAGIYDGVFIDEIQDLSGWDFDLLEKFLLAQFRTVMVG